MRSSKQMVVVLAAIVALGSVLLAGGCAFRATVGSRDVGVSDRLMTVTGQGKVTASPDQVTVTIGVDSRADNPGAAMDANSKAMTKVIDAIESLGVRDTEIVTSGINLYPEYFYPQNQPPQVVGYVASSQVTVKLKETGKASEVIAKAIEAGATNVNGLQFGLSEDSEARLQALREAYANARTKAEALAKEMGVKILRVHSASESAGPAELPYAQLRAVGGAEGEVTPPPIQEQTIEVVASVTVTYEIR